MNREARLDSIRQEIGGKTGMPPELESDLLERIAEVEESGSLVPPMGKGDIIVGILAVALLGILPVILIGIGVW